MVISPTMTAHDAHFLHRIWFNGFTPPCARFRRHVIASVSYHLAFVLGEEVVAGVPSFRVCRKRVRHCKSFWMENGIMSGRNFGDSIAYAVWEILRGFIVRHNRVFRDLLRLFIHTGSYIQPRFLRSPFLLSLRYRFWRIIAL